MLSIMKSRYLLLSLSLLILLAAFFWWGMPRPTVFLTAVPQGQIHSSESQWQSDVVPPLAQRPFALAAPSARPPSPSSGSPSAVLVSGGSDAKALIPKQSNLRHPVSAAPSDALPRRPSFVSPLSSQVGPPPGFEPSRPAENNEVGPLQGVELAVEVPMGQDVPLVLVPVDQSDGFSSRDLSVIGAEADRFILEASQGGTVPRPDPVRWQSARQQSDEHFRTWYGTEAYMAMQARRYFESQQPPLP